MNMYVLSFKCSLLRGSVRSLERVRVHACMRVFFFVNVDVCWSAASTAELLSRV